MFKIFDSSGPMGYNPKWTWNCGLGRLCSTRVSLEGAYCTLGVASIKLWARDFSHGCSS